MRDGDWKLVWLTPLPGAIQLFNLALDPGESNDVAAANPAKVKALQDQVIALAKEMQPPLFAAEALRSVLASPPVFGAPKPAAAHGED